MVAKAAPKPLPPLLCLECGSENPGETNFCFECGSRLRSPSSMRPPPPAPHVVGPRKARLVAVRRDGTDGAAYPFEQNQLDIGRTEGDLRFDDPHLASRHARLIRESGGYVLVPLELRNGIYLKISTPTPLASGDYLLVGKQVLLFEEIPEVERSLTPGIEQGVVLFGTPTRPPWGRLRQMTAAGTARDVYHLTRTEMVLGREQGDIVFSGDEFMSRRHAAIRLKAGLFELEDLESSNGTFIRLRTQHTLCGGEMLRLGDELLRFELL
jgi:pSer/pThr/pTyr-binding forkhead associated (FHA) protein